MNRAVHHKISGITLSILLAVGGLAFVGGVVLAEGSNTLTGCLSDKGNLSRVAIGNVPQGSCKADEAEVSWNQEGPPGPAGSGGASIATIRLFGPGPAIGSGCPDSTEYHAIGSACPGSGTQGGDLATVFDFDPADYPADAAVTFGRLQFTLAGETHCVRLYSVTAAAPVSGSEACVTNATTSNAFTRPSPVSVQLDAGTYVVQDKHSGAFMGSGGLAGAWLTVDWN